MAKNESLASLRDFIGKIPAITHLSSGYEGDTWWVKFSIDLEHGLAWQVVQELAHVLNCLSLESKLPTVFYPVSPPPYLNGGPEAYLSWVIENTDGEFSPDLATQWLEGRLPNPVDIEEEWG